MGRLTAGCFVVETMTTLDAIVISPLSTFRPFITNRYVTRTSLADSGESKAGSERERERKCKSSTSP